MPYRIVVLCTAIVLQLLVSQERLAADEFSTGAQELRAPLNTRASSRRQTPRIATRTESVADRSDAIAHSDSASDKSATKHSAFSENSTKPTGWRQDAMDHRIRIVLTTLSWMGVLALSLVFWAKLRGATAAPGMAKRLEVLSTIKIAPRCCLSVVSANGQEFLLARDAGGVKSIVALQCNFDDYVASSTDDTDFAAISLDRHQP